MLTGYTLTAYRTITSLSMRIVVNVNNKQLEAKKRYLLGKELTMYLTANYNDVKDENKHDSASGMHARRTQPVPKINIHRGGRIRSASRGYAVTLKQVNKYYLHLLFNSLLASLG